MRGFRIAMVSMILSLGVGAAHADSTTQLYTSKHVLWGLLVGNCQLKVQSFGAGVVFIPVGNSSLQFEGVIPDSRRLDQPLKLVQTAARGDAKLTETLNVFFAQRGTEVVPTGYTLSREYTRKTGEDKKAVRIEQYSVNCTDLQPDSI